MSTLVFPPALTRGPLTCTNPVELRDAAALTASYVVTTHDVITMGVEEVVFDFTYDTTGADENTVEGYVEGFNGVDWFRISEKSPAIGGVAELGIPPLQWTRTDFPAGVTKFMSPPFLTSGAQRVRAWFKKSEGTSPSLLAVSAVGASKIRI